LTKQDDAAEVVGVVGGERDELITHGHDAGWRAGAGWATDGMVEAADVLSCCGGLLGSVEEALEKLWP
jgi:hypothetical protein